MFSPSSLKSNKSFVSDSSENESAELTALSVSPPVENYHTFVDVELDAAPLIGRRTPSMPIFSPSAATYNRQALDLSLRAQQFFTGLESGALLRSLVAALRDKLHHFNLMYPKQQTLGERIFCFVYERRLQCILTSVTTDTDKYFFLCGFVEEMELFLHGVREQQQAVRELDFKAFQETWFAWVHTDTVRERYAAATFYQENYRSFSRRNAAMANVPLNEFPALEQKQFNTALSALVNAKKGHLEHYRIAQTIALRVQGLVENDTAPDYKFYVLVLQQVYAVAQKHPLISSSAWLEKLADLVEGNTQSHSRLGQLLKNTGLFCCLRRGGLSKMLMELVDLATTSALEHAPVMQYR